VLELRGAIYMARMRKRVEDVRPLIALLEQPLDRETRMRIAGALEAITQDPRYGTDAEKWKSWADRILGKGVTREKLLEANRAGIYRETSDLLSRELESSITALGEKELESIELFFNTPYPDVTVAAARRVGELYTSVADEGIRKKIQLSVLPMLMGLLDHHWEDVVVSALNAMAMMSRPSLDDVALCKRIRGKTLALVEDGTEAMRFKAVLSLGGYADPADRDVAMRLQKILEGAADRPVEFRVALVNTLGAYAQDASAALFQRLTMEDKEEAVCTAAASVFLKIKPTVAIETLSGILERQGTSPTFRRRIVDMLGNVITRHPGVIRPLKACLQVDRDIKVLIICADGLGYAKGKDSDQAGMVLHERLKQSPGGGEPKLAEALVTSLGRLGYWRAVPDLIMLLEKAEGELRIRTRAALVSIATHEVKRTHALLVQLMTHGLNEAVAEAYRSLIRDAEKAKRLSELQKDSRHEISVLYIRALMGIGTRQGQEKNLEEALTEVQNLRRTSPVDPELLLLEGRLLHLGGTPKSEALLAFQKANRMVTKDPTQILEWNLLTAWAHVRLGKKDAVTHFKVLHTNVAADLSKPFSWEVLIGNALALLNADPEGNRAQVTDLLAKVPEEAFEKHAARWLKNQLGSIQSVLKPTEPSNGKGSEKPK